MSGVPPISDFRVRVGGGILPGWVMKCRVGAAALRVTGIFGRRRVPKISRGLSIFIYCELWVGLGIPVDGPELRMAPNCPNRSLATETRLKIASEGPPW